MGLHKADEKVGRASKLPILAATAFCAATAAFQVWAAEIDGGGSAENGSFAVPVPKLLE